MITTLSLTYDSVDRIAEKKPHLLSKLNYLGSKKAAITEKSELLSPTIIDEDTAS